MKLWDSHTGKLVAEQVLDGPMEEGSQLTSLQQLPNGQLMATSEDGKLQFVDPRVSKHPLHLTEAATAFHKRKYNMAFGYAFFGGLCSWYSKPWQSRFRRERIRAKLLSSKLELMLQNLWRMQENLSCEPE